MSRPRRGMTLLELVVAMAIFSLFLLILTGLGSQYRTFDRAVRMRWFLHPDDMAIVARVRRDVADSTGYPASFASMVQSPKTLILSRGPGRTVTWEFDEDAAVRTEWTGANAGARWTAGATRRFEIGAWELPDGTVAVRLTGRAADGGVVVDRIVAPRPE